MVVVCGGGGGMYLQNFLILADSGNSFSSQWAVTCPRSCLRIVHRGYEPPVPSTKEKKEKARTDQAKNQRFV